MPKWIAFRVNHRRDFFKVMKMTRECRQSLTNDLVLEKIYVCGRERLMLFSCDYEDYHKTIKYLHRYIDEKIFFSQAELPVCRSQTIWKKGEKKIRFF